MECNLSQLFMYIFICYVMYLFVLCDLIILDSFGESSNKDTDVKVIKLATKLLCYSNVSNSHGFYTNTNAHKLYKRF